MTSENIDYKNLLEAYLTKGRLPLIVSLTDQPKDANDVVTYNKWCLATYLERLYALQDEAAILIFKLEDLKSRFLEKYYVAPNREEAIMAARMHTIDDIRKITGDQCKYAVHLYNLIKSGREETLFTKKFSRKSYEVFKQYALVYDLIKFKVYLEELSENLEPIYKNISFGLNSTQIERLYRFLRGAYISNDTKLTEFQAVLNLHKIERGQRVKWVCAASRNKNQLNKSALFELVFSLNELSSSTGKQLNPEVYAFINNSFVDESGKDLPNLKDAYRNYKELKEPNTINIVKKLVADIKVLKNKAPF